MGEEKKGMPRMPSDAGAGGQAVRDVAVEDIGGLGDGDGGEDVFNDENTYSTYSLGQSLFDPNEAEEKDDVGGRSSVRNFEKDVGISEDDAFEAEGL